MDKSKINQSRIDRLMPDGIPRWIRVWKSDTEDSRDGERDWNALLGVRKKDLTN